MKSNVSKPDREPAGPGFRRFLQDELARRCLDNPQYSLRAFAGRLGTDHSTLSQIIRGRRRLTERTIRRVGERLGLPGDEIEQFVVRQRGLDATSPRERQVRRLTRDMVNVLSDWYHYAILELVHLRGFRPDSRWIARTLGIDVDEVNGALARLLRLRLLEMTPEGWNDLSGDTTASFGDFTRAAIQRLFEQIRELSLASSEADLSSSTVAVDRRRIPEIRQRLEHCRREILSLIELDDERNDVYQIELNVFPITKLNKKDTLA